MPFMSPHVRGGVRSGSLDGGPLQGTGLGLPSVSIHLFPPSLTHFATGNGGKYNGYKASLTLDATTLAFTSWTRPWTLFVGVRGGILQLTKGSGRARLRVGCRHKMFLGPPEYSLVFVLGTLVNTALPPRPPCLLLPFNDEACIFTREGFVTYPFLQGRGFCRQVPLRSAVALMKALLSDFAVRGARVIATGSRFYVLATVCYDGPWPPFPDDLHVFRELPLRQPCLHGWLPSSSHRSADLRS